MMINNRLLLEVKMPFFKKTRNPYLINFLLGNFKAENRELALQTDIADAVEATKRFSRGNISVQFGEFEDRNELETARQEIREIKLP